MDPISLIIAALAAGAIAGVKDTAGQAVKDAYTGLKALLRRRFAGNRKAEAALDQAERQPESDQALLAQHLRAAGAGQRRGAHQGGTGFARASRSGGSQGREVQRADHRRERHRGRRRGARHDDFQRR